MNDQPNQPADDSETGTTETPKKPETPPGMLPLVEPFFGVKAFYIAAVPFLIYLVGSYAGGHFESTRKTQPLHELKGVCRARGEALGKKAEQTLLAEEAKTVLEGIGYESVMDAMNDESSKLKGLFKKCQKLIDTRSFDNTPASIREDIQALRDHVDKFLELEEYKEKGEANKIRPGYNEFMKKNDPNFTGLKFNKSWYPTTYTITCAAATLAMFFYLPTYFKRVPFRISGMALAVGVIGIVLWIALWWLNKGVYTYLYDQFGIETPSRAAFNPFEELKSNTLWMWAFLGIRIWGMCLVVPIVEEFFLRGFLMRYAEDIDWDQIPIGEATWRGLACVVAYATFTHIEVLAAIVWFSMVTWMYLRTKNIWDCVVAHAVTNMLLAAFVLYTGIWELW